MSERSGGWEKELRLESAAALDDTALRREEDFERTLEKAIDRRIRHICLKTILAAAILAAAVFLGLSPLMDAVCPTPARLKNSGVPLTAYLRAYYESVQPYTEIIAGVETIEKRGFGRYTVRFQSTDHVGRLAVGRCNAAAEFEYGTFRITENDENACGALTPVLLNRFGSGEEGGKERALEQIRELPASSRVYLSVTAPEAVAVESLRRQEDVAVEWVRIDSDSRWQGGLNLAFSTCGEADSWREDMDDAALRQQYLDNLTLLLSEPRLVQDLSFWTEDDHGGGILYPGSAVVREAYDAAASQSGPLMTRQYSFFGKRDAVAAYLERTDLSGVSVEAAELI